MKTYPNTVYYASKDYDIELHIVKSIYDKHPYRFYEELEDYIKERRLANE